MGTRARLRYLTAPRRDVLVLRELCARGRAAPRGDATPRDDAAARLFERLWGLPDVLAYRVLQFWRTERDGRCDGAAAVAAKGGGKSGWVAGELT